MKFTDVITLIGILLTFEVSIAGLIYNVIRNRRTDFISRVTDYRLKWIDLARGVISNYLLCADKLARGKDADLENDFAAFQEKHWQMESFMTTFSEVDKTAVQELEAIYKSAIALIDPACSNRDDIRETIYKALPGTSEALRKTMDNSWKSVRNELG